MTACAPERWVKVFFMILLALVFLTVLLLAHAHLGAMPTLAQSTEAILQ